MTVYPIGKVISQTVQLNFCYIFQTEYFTVRKRFDNDIFKLFRLLQASFITDGILESLVTAFTELSWSSFDILFCQSSGNITGNELVLCHDIRS